MRATRLIILGAASHVCCGQSLYHRDLDTFSRPGNGRHVHSRPQAGRREASRPWFVSGGGAEAGDDEKSPTRWWRSRKRWAKRQAEKKAAEERAAASSSAAALMARKHVMAIQGMLRRLKRWLGIIVDIATLKRLRLLRQARQKGSWQHGGPIPARYRGLLQELRQEIAAKPGLERRAKKVHHELDTVALGRFLEAAFWSLEHDGSRVSDIIEQSIGWRDKIGADRLRKEDVIDQGRKGAILVKGHDLSRRPVVYFRPALDGRMDGDENSKLMIYNLERAIRLMPRHSWQYTIVIDCEGMGLKQLPPVAYMKQMFQLLGHHYPMRLGHVLFTNVGPSVMLCWKVVSPLLQARTKAKMHLIPSTNLAQTARYIDPSQLLDFAGGQSSWRFDAATYFAKDAASL